MATVEIISGERPYYIIRVTLTDGRAFDQLVFVDKLAAAVPAALAGYAAAMQAGIPPADERNPSTNDVAGDLFWA
jgi:hypothetical protein